MRIWQQGLIVYDELPAYRAVLDKYIRSIVRPDTEVVLHGFLPGSYASNYPIRELQFGPMAHLHFNQLLAAGIAAEQQGFDAYAMGFMAGPLLPELRSLLNIPVVNYLEAVAHFASFFGQRFGFIQFAPEIGTWASEYLTQWGLERKFAGVVSTSFSHSDVFGGFDNPGPVIERFEETVRQFVRATGADVVVPGEMPLNLFLSANGLHRVDGVPIIDGCAITLMLAEMMVDLAKRFGLHHSRHGQKNATAPMDRLTELVAFYGLDRMWASIAARGQPDA
jgi:allantoin racemase